MKLYHNIILTTTMKAQQSSMQIPFTELWHSFSRQRQKQNIAPYRQNKSSKNSKNQKPCQQDLQMRKRGYSFNTLFKKTCDLDSSQMALQNITNQIQKQLNSKATNKHPPSNRKRPHSQNQQTSTNSIPNPNKSTSQQKHTNSIISIAQSQNCYKIRQKVLKIVQTNVIPFMVDKFVELETRVCAKMQQLQQKCQEQKKEIEGLKDREQVYKTQGELYRRLLEGYIKFQGNPHKSYNAGRTSNGGQRGDAFGVYDKIKGLEERGKVVQEIQQKNTQRVQQLSNFIEETKHKFKQLDNHKQHFKDLENKITQILQKQKISDEKIQKQFAERILQLIETYNQNFVDLDKRMNEIEEQFVLKHESFQNDVQVSSNSLQSRKV